MKKLRGNSVLVIEEASYEGSDDESAAFRNDLEEDGEDDSAFTMNVKEDRTNKASSNNRRSVGVSEAN